MSTVPKPCPRCGGTRVVDDDDVNPDGMPCPDCAVDPPCLDVDCDLDSDHEGDCVLVPVDPEEGNEFALNAEGYDGGPVDPPTGQWTVDGRRAVRRDDPALTVACSSVAMAERVAAALNRVRLVEGQATPAPEPTAEQVRTLIDAVLAWIDAPQGVPKLDAYYPLVDAAEDVRAALTGEAAR